MAEPGKANGLVASLSGMRLIAALTVVYVHSANAFVAMVPLRAVASVAYPVVDFFFLLSGFVIAWTWKPELSARAFWRRRAARIVPLHIVTWAVAVPVLWMELDQLRVLPSIAALFFMTAWVPDPAWYHAANGVAWSLTGELVFYAGFPFLRPRIERLTTKGLLRLSVACILVVEAAALITVLVVPVERQIGVLYINPLWRAVECWAGAAVAVAIQRGWRPRVPVALVAGWLLTTFAVLAVLTVRLDTTLPGSAVAFATQRLPHGVSRPLGIMVMLPIWVLLLAALAGRDVDGRPVRALAWRPLVSASTWTYALYMTHGPLVKLVNAGLKHVAWTRTTAGGLAIEAAFLVFSLAVAWLAYSYLERPCERRLRTSRRRAQVPAQRTPRSSRVPAMEPSRF